MKRIVSVISVILVLFSICTFTASAAEIPKATKNFFVNDFANVISNADEEKMQQQGLNVLPLDDDMVHILASSLFNGMFETVRHDTPKEKAVAYVDTLRIFYSAGWFKILGI